METTATTSSIDRAIENYKTLHGGNKPLYCIMSAEEADELASNLKRLSGHPENIIITSYEDIRIIRDKFMEWGEYFLSNELPETGS